MKIIFKEHKEERTIERLLFSFWINKSRYATFERLLYDRSIESGLDLLQFQCSFVQKTKKLNDIFVFDAQYQ